MNTTATNSSSHPFFCFLLSIFRYMPPVTPSTWKNTRLADHFSPVCPQSVPVSDTGMEALLEMPRGRLAQLRRMKSMLTNHSEDCLYLNMYVPREGECWGLLIIPVCDSDNFICTDVCFSSESRWASTEKMCAWKSKKKRLMWQAFQTNKTWRHEGWNLNTKTFLTYRFPLCIGNWKQNTLKTKDFLSAKF